MSDGPLGTVITLPATYIDKNGALVDPSPAPILSIRLPDLTTVTPIVTHDSAGKYHCDYKTVQAGHHAWWYDSNLGGVGDVFNVGQSASTSIVSLTAAKRHIQVDADDYTDDAEMRDFLTQVTDMINSSCGYSAPTEITEYVSCQSNGSRSLVLSEWPVLTVDSVVGTSAWPVPVDSASFVNAGGIVTMNTGASFYGQQLVTYTVGRSVVPDDLQELALILFKWMWETQRGSTGGAGSIPGLGTGDEAEGGRYGHPVPERAVAIMEKYFRPNV